MRLVLILRDGIATITAVMRPRWKKYKVCVCNTCVYVCVHDGHVNELRIYPEMPETQRRGIVPIFVIGIDVSKGAVPFNLNKWTTPRITYVHAFLSFHRSPTSIEVDARNFDRHGDGKDRRKDLYAIPREVPVRKPV